MTQTQTRRWTGGPRCSTCHRDAHAPGTYQGHDFTEPMPAPVPVDAKARIRELNRTPKAELARMHVANGGQMGLPIYLKWRKDELVSIVAEDEGIDPWSA